MRCRNDNEVSTVEALLEGWLPMSMQGMNMMQPLPLHHCGAVITGKTQAMMEVPLHYAAG